MILFFSIFSVLYFLDIATKIWIRHSLPLGAEIPITSFFSIIHVQNTGVAFGLFAGRNNFFVVVGVVLSFYLIVMAIRSSQDLFFRGVLAVILAGAWGNLTDRLVYGRVTDFLDFYWGLNHWPAFNVADSAICVGAGLLIWQLFRTNRAS